MALMVLVELSGLMTNQAQSARMHKKGISVVNQSICRNRDVCLAAVWSVRCFITASCSKKLKIELY